jgi:ribonuclease HII
VLYYERQAKKKGYSVILGIDEAGRGPLAGPIVVAAVYLKTFRFEGRIDDSKKLTAGRRNEAFLELSRKSVFNVGVMNEGAIDALNVSRAARLCVDIAVARLLKSLKKPRPTRRNTILLLDGCLSSSLPYDSKEIIGGDGASLSIASASIIAKVIRDRIMAIYDRIYPRYGFGAHKGYGTKKHFENIARYGLTPIHRKTFCGGVFPSHERKD